MYIPSKTVKTTPDNPISQLLSIGFVGSGGSGTGVLGNGANQNVDPFSLSGTSVSLNAEINIANQCVPQNPPVTCQGAAIVMPDAHTAIVALNATGSNYLLEIGSLSATPTFTPIPIGGGTFTPEDTAGLAMSTDTKVLASRGHSIDIFSQTGTDAYAQVNQFLQPDPPDQSANRGREGMFVANLNGDYILLLTGTIPGPSGGTLQFFDNITSPTTQSPITSTVLGTAQRAYAVTSDGRTAFVGTDVGIAVVPGVNSKKFGTPSIITPIAGIGATLVQVSTLAITPDNNWLVAMGLPSTAGATGPGGTAGYIDVMPILYGSHGSVTLGPAEVSQPIVVPTNDQLVVF